MASTLARILALVSILLVLSATAAESTVQVRTEPLIRQRMTESLTGFGTVIADIGAAQVVSLPRAGQLLALRVAPGQVVAQGAPLFDFATGAAGAQSHEQARAAVDFARGEVRRIGELVTQKLATSSQLAAARKNLADAAANLKAQEQLGTDMPLQTVSAPFGGVVLSLSVSQGDRVAAGAPILVLARSGRLRVQLGIEPEDVSRVMLGMPVALVPVFDERTVIAARVAEVHGTVNPQTRLVDVAVRLPGNAPTLLPGMQVRGTITLRSETVLTVPRSAVLRDAAGYYLFQVQANRARRVAVTPGIEADSRVAVRGALDPAQQVVTVGNYELKDGMAVRGAPQ